MTTGHEGHKIAAPAILKMIVDHSATEAEAHVLVESVLLGVMLFYGRDVRGTSELLDAITMRVINRMPS